MFKNKQAILNVYWRLITVHFHRITISKTWYGARDLLSEVCKEAQAIAGGRLLFVFLLRLYEYFVVDSQPPRTFNMKYRNLRKFPTKCLPVTESALWRIRIL